MDGLISIVLPVYNGEKYLRESIESVLSQTYTNWELLILDDCSNDHSSDIAKEYVGKDRRILYYRNEENLRLPRNLNKGFSLAKGDYLTWTSDDNRFRSNALEVMYQTLQEQSAKFVFASCRIINEKGEEIEYISVGSNSVRDIVGRNSVGACFLYTRDVYETIGEYDPDMELVEDYDYWQKVIANFKAVPISETLYEYRWHDGALTNTMKREKYLYNLERMLLKNIHLFGKLSIRQKYLFYCALSNTREGKQNPYYFKEKIYSIIYFILYRIPRKTVRILKMFH